MNKWISVKDGLPEIANGTSKYFNIAFVSKYDGKTYVRPAVYLNQMELTSSYTFEEEVFTGWFDMRTHPDFDEYYQKIENGGGDKVTHWMPLPEPPND